MVSLETTVQVLRALGGDRAVSVLTGADYKNVETWKRSKTFPARYFLVMFLALRNSGHSASPSLWRQIDPADRKRALQALIEVQQQKVEAA
jgi:hypothetical protein